MAIHLPQHSVGPALPGKPDRGVDAGLVLAQAADGPERLPRSLYIHTPFCVHKCHYCDFYSFVDNRDRQAAFTDRLIDELSRLAPFAAPLHTVFIGGGTPSLLRTDLWERLLVAIAERFDLSPIREGRRDGLGQAEFTVECNPESTTAELLGILKSGGVNRVSVGAQSFNPRHLKTLERWHDPANVARAIELARAAGILRQSLDLIFAIPGQTLDEWDDDLRRALALGTTHLSCYNLTYEPTTAMTKRLELGEFEPCPNELEAELFSHTLGTLRGAGLDRYEVSNFAAPGEQSRHNIAYWVQEPWLAAGPSASGHLMGRGSPGGHASHAGSWRFKNVPRLGDYLDSAGFSPVVDVEAPDPLRLVRERIMMGIRLSAGLDAAGILDDVHGLAPAAVATLRRAVDRMIDQGWVLEREDRWTLTDAGFLMGDHVASELMRTV